MRAIIKGRWAIFAVWLIVTIVLTIFQPDINAILRDQGQEGTSEDSPSVLAEDILKKMETTEGTDNLIVFHDENKISDDDMKEIEKAVDSLDKNKSEIGITNMIDPFNMPDAKDSLVSEDDTTLMVSYKLDKKDREIDDIEPLLEEQIAHVPVDTYLSGEEFINNDYLKATQSGVEKSAALTVVFILVVLILVYRSVVTPVVSLLAVAFSYLVSMGIAAQLIDKAGFPVTSLTQMLLVLILFGLGTDYNILLFNRFKEEIAKGLSINEAIVKTYKTAGKTIAYSILTVFIAFLALIFSESPIYQSGVVVVIGVSILLLEILTLTPFIMKVLGKNLFWPSKNVGAHKENKFWGKASTIGAKHPIIITLIALLIFGPMILFHDEKLNFDTVAELGDDYPSSKAINLVSKHFGKGQSMPATVVIENEETLDNNDALAVIDDITNRLNSLEGVKEVSSVTQPLGEKIDDFYIDEQMGTVTGGLSDTRDGVDTIQDGMSEAEKELGDADFSEVDDMVDGTASLENGMSELTAGLQQIQAGLDDGSSDQETLANGIATIKTNLSEMSGGLSTLTENYNQMQDGFEELGNHYQGAAQALLGIKEALPMIQSMVEELGGSYAELNEDERYVGLQQTVDELVASLEDITPESMNQLNEQYNTATAGFNTANESLGEINNGLVQITDGLEQLQDGLNEASSGIGTIVTNMNEVENGLSEMKAGQEQLAEGLNEFGAFGDQLSEINGGLADISDGIGSTNDYLAQLNSKKTFFMPEEALEDDEFEDALDSFMSDDRTITKMTVILDDDPYSTEALNTIESMNSTIANGLVGTELSKADYGTTGSSATTNDMNNILSSDLDKTTIIVIAGVLLVLFFVIRSFWTPIFITASLVAAYYAAMFTVNYIFLNILGHEGLSSFVPFFSFIIIVSLGVDYSIFLMMRFKEYPNLTTKEAIILASKHIGGVIISAVIILGGTFATLLPAGIVLLSELAIAVITGLIVLCFILLPVVLPALMVLPELISNKLATKKEKAISIKET